GSTAVEVALKMALGYWLHRGEPRHRILVLEHGYHGDTIGAMSIGARGAFNRAYEPLLFDVATIPFPAEGHEQVTLDALATALRDGPAALIV
ncbi:aminotransferase class III-fold pyridoxal phosphate-dependent enzyme, partial [Escherichia coli]|nr:aminotransferase class III-fold pyridoxal phosphate-dependent enzyme [Escherichia coli]